MTQCCALLCKNIGIHIFPKDPTRRKKWENALRKKNFKASKTARLCSAHFKESDYFGRSIYTAYEPLAKFLRKTAVPSIFSFTEIKQESPAALARQGRVKKRQQKKLFQDSQPSTSNELSNISNLVIPVDRVEHIISKAIDSIIPASLPSSTHIDHDHIYGLRNRYSPMLEVCIDSLESALNAIHGGADELEVCSSLSEGGLTPTAGLVQEILSMVNNVSAGLPVHKTCSKTCHCIYNLKQRPKVNVMIRCRTGSEFCYSELDMDTMLADIEVFKQMKVDRFVFGALDEGQRIHEENCARVIAKAFPIPVTFHRAYDVTTDPIESINKIVGLGFNRLLTSGQRKSADDDKALELIKRLISSFGHKIDIMPGAGVNVSNVKKFSNMGCKIVHSSCKIVRVLPKVENSLSMGTSDSECVFVTEANIVENMKEVLS